MAMTEEERRLLYGPEKGHYNSDGVEGTVPQPQPELLDAGPDHPMLDANKQSQVVPAGSNVNPVVAPAAQAAAATPTEDVPAQPATAEESLQQAQDNLDRVNNESEREEAAIRADRNKTFAQMVLDYNDRLEQERKQQRIQEQANVASSMATGATELAANLINMFSVGGLHASNQQYRSYAQDWMRKADADIREHRRRQDNMRGALDRIKLQQQQIAQAGRLADIKQRQQRAAAELAAAQDAYDREQREREKTAAQDSAMLAKGFRPDPSDPSGYRFDPSLARQISGARSTRSASRGRQRSSGRGNTAASAATPTPQQAGAPSAGAQAGQYRTQSANATAAPAAPGGFRDYAYRIPRNESEWEQKRQVQGWEMGPLRDGEPVPAQAAPAPAVAPTQASTQAPASAQQQNTKQEEDEWSQYRL